MMNHLEIIYLLHQKKKSKFLHSSKSPTKNFQLPAPNDSIVEDNTNFEMADDSYISQMIYLLIINIYHSKGF